MYATVAKTQYKGTMIQITRRLTTAGLFIGLLPILHGCGSSNSTTADTSSSAAGNEVAAGPGANAAPGGNAAPADANAAPADANAAPAAAPAGFKEFAPPNYGASLLMPGTPTEHKSEHADQWRCNDGVDSAYFITSMEVADPQAAAAKMAADLSPGDKIKSAPTKITVSGCDGTDYSTVDKDGILTSVRTINADKKLYILNAASTKPGAEATNLQGFFDSFKLTAPK